MEQLVILDFCTQEVHVYFCNPDADINEEYISNLGYHTSECSWMFGENITIKHHNEILK